MKKLFGNHRSLRILAMLLCVAMIAGVIGMQTKSASAAPGGNNHGGATNQSSLSFTDNLDSITWVDEPTAKTVKFEYVVKNNTNHAITISYTWEGKEAGADKFVALKLLDPEDSTHTKEKPNPSMQTINGYSTFDNTLTIVLDSSLVNAKRGMVYRCKIDYVENGVENTITTNEVSVDYKAVVKFFNTNNDKAYNRQEVAYEGTVTKPTDPKDGDKTFECWVDANGNEFKFDTPITSPMSLYAKYSTVKTVNVTFVYYTVEGHPHGHSNSYVIKVPEGKAPAAYLDDKVTNVKCTSTSQNKNDHIFVGWYTDTSLAEKYDFTLLINSDVTVYGKWCTTNHKNTATKEVEIKKPTCTESGEHYLITYCKECGEELKSEKVTDDPLGHELGEAVYKETKKATCKEEGAYILEKFCQRDNCGHSEKVGEGTINKLAHDFGDAVEENVEAATCTKKGSYDLVKHCKNCNYCEFFDHVETDMLPHDLDKAVKENVKPATCEDDGSYDLVQHCKNCDYSKVVDTVTVDKKGHQPGSAEIENFEDSTCAITGSYDEVVYCTVCGKELSRDTKTIEKKKHTNSDPVEENRVEATCDEDGSYESVVYCTVCGEVVSRTTITIPATEHEAGDAVVEKTVAATCTVDGSYDSVIYCKECKDEISRKTITVKAQGHQPKAAVKENFKDSTCTATGSYDSVVYCEVCGLELSRDTVVIAKKAHEPGEVEILNRVDPTFTAEGSYNKVVKCKHCGETLSSDKVTVDKLTAEIVSVTISGLDKAKNVYIVGDKLNVDNIEVVTKLSDGTERRTPISVNMVTGFDSTKPAESLTLTVAVEGATGTYKVAVNPIPVYTVEGDTTWDGINNMNLTVHRSFNDAITFSLFDNLMYAGKVVDVTNYDAASGSLKLALHKDYLKSLGEGTYTFTINFKDGFATVDVVIPNFEEPKNEEPKQEEPAKSETEVIPVEDNKTAVDNTKVEEKKADEKTDSPKTADTSDIATWFILLILAMAAASVAMYCNKKRSSRA